MENFNAMGFCSKYFNLYSLMQFIEKGIRFIVFLAMTCLFATTIQAQPQRAYDRGLELVYQGNITQALDEWYSAYEGAESVDSRIGFEFIRVVTEEGQKEYYGNATEMYYQALTRGMGRISRVAIRQEIDRLQPLIGEGIYRQWQEWWEENNSKLGVDMLGYWVQLDPTPAQLSNERLIEHWQRIAESRERFTKNGETIYGTDERALIYIRYGEPDRTEAGILTLQSFNIKPWLQNQFNPSQNEDDVTGADRTTFEDSEWERLNQLENMIYEFHQYPEYEFWFYDRIAEGVDETVPFVFGTDPDTEEFSLQGSIENFIPERAYYPERTRDEEESDEFTRVGITPALMLQLLYYEQVTDVDNFFRNRFNSLREKVLEQGIGALQGMDLEFTAESRELINQRVNEAPRQRSTYQKQLPEIPLKVYHYRFLDESQEPFIITYIETDPQQAFLIDYHRNRDNIDADMDVQPGQNILDILGDYDLIHYLYEYDDDWNISESYQDNPALVIGNSSGGPASASVFQKPHLRRANQAVSVELLNYNPDTRAVYETPFSDELRGLNSIQYRLPEPLDTNEDTLEVADLVLGYESEQAQTEPFSFVVANNQIIPLDATLLLHFEVYNVERMDNGFTQFELTYRILPVNEDGRVNTDTEEFVLTLNFTNEERRVVEDLEIQTTELGIGLYELRVNVEDMTTGQSKERRIRFEVEDQ